MKERNIIKTGEIIHAKRRKCKRERKNIKREESEDRKENICKKKVGILQNEA